MKLYQRGESREGVKIFKMASKVAVPLRHSGHRRGIQKSCACEKRPNWFGRGPKLNQTLLGTPGHPVKRPGYRVSAPLKLTGNFLAHTESHIYCW